MIRRRRGTAEAQACGLQASLRDAGFLAGANPALKCRAIFPGSLRDSFRGLREPSYGR